MTRHTYPSHRLLGLEVWMTLLLLLAYVTAAMAAGAGWGRAVSEMLAGLDGSGVTPMELEPSAHSAQGLGP
jgi:hypothetical protein